ncbi:MAG: oligosaccharide flippase family protein [Solirubrobacterales bacterium]|nr:oligosaccharide flippase family protein [Solirubrobacterales bacterium]
MSVAAAKPLPTGRTYGMDVVITVGGKGVFVVFSGLLVVLSARILGPEGQGVFAVAVSLLMVLVQMGSLGLAISAPFYTAREPSLQRAIAFTLLRIAIIVSLVLCVGTIGIKALAPGTLPGVGWGLLTITLGAVPAAIAALYLQGVLLGQQRAIPFNLMEIAQAVSTVLALVVLTAVRDVDVADVVLLTAAGRYVSLFVALFALRHLLLSRMPGSADGLARRLLDRGRRIYIVTFLSFALIRLDLLLVNALLGSRDAGLYSIASYVTEALIVIPAVVGSMLLPRLAKSAEPRLSPEAFRVIAVVWGGICLISLPMAYIGLPIVFGTEFRDSAGLYAWLVLGTFCVGLLSTLVVHFVVSDYPRELLVAWGIGLALNVLLNLVLLRPLGVTAAPIISSVSYAFVLGWHLKVYAHANGGYRALRPQPSEILVTLRAAFGR